MKKIILSLTILITLFTNYNGFAQQDFTLYNMEAIPQRMYSNPALIPTQSRVNIGLPIMSSHYLNFSNSGFKYSDLIKHSGDSLAVDYENMLSKLSANNYFSSAFQPDLLSFGFKIKKNYFSFNATEKINFQVRYPKNFMELIWKGNGGLLGQEVNLNFGANFIHYREYALGFAREINDKLTIGGKLKYLYGMENVWTERFDVTLTTDPNDFSITARSNIKINTSGLDTNSFDNFNFSNYAFKKKNKGLGIDLGGVYKLNDKITLSGSVIDLGYIRWADATTTYQSNNPNGKFTYQGLDLNQLLNDSTNSTMKVLADTLAKSFKIDTLHNTPYSRFLSTQIYLGGTYKLTEKINTGILFYGQIFDKSIHPGLALSYNQRVGRWLSFSATYSIYNRSYNNVGLGFALNPGAVQFYMVSDNLLGALFPQNAKNLHLHFGVNLIFGRKTKDRDGDGVKDKKDDCPDVAGLKELHGCPDKDHDGIADKDDLCPADSGLVSLKGCPDKDGDGIADKDDACPDVAGLAQFKGCPDKDGDGVIDKEDDCPDVKGLATLKGCPDRDGDGVSDKDDVCPDVAGLIKNKGCPDKDGDGVIDKDDACPDKPGPASNRGCPEVKISSVDLQGNPLKSAVLAKDSSFTFDNLPADELVRLKLEGEGTGNINKVRVIVGGVSKIGTRDSKDGYFHFAVTPPEEVKEVVVVLDKKEAEVLKKAFNNLEFAPAKDIIKAGSLASLDELAGLMAKKSSWKLKISGHTDNQGNAGTNLILSQKRAEAVKNYLVSKGIAAERFKVEWFGSTKPIADNKTEAGRQKNRRVEMLIIE